MNGLTLLLCGTALFLAGYAVYSKFIARVLGVDPSRPTPAHTQGDGCASRAAASGSDKPFSGGESI